MRLSTSFVPSLLTANDSAPAFVIELANKLHKVGKLTTAMPRKPGPPRTPERYGDARDVAAEHDARSEDEVVDHVVSTLAEDSGALRCRHGDRLVVLYARGVAALEVAPRGAVL